MATTPGRGTADDPDKIIKTVYIAGVVACISFGLVMDGKRADEQWHYEGGSSRRDADPRYLAITKHCIAKLPWNIVASLLWPAVIGAAVLGRTVKYIIEH